ncbi:hypothetical protein QQF64_013599 [Cirrhinus molitorella]|uniref:Uncharacterized protein n=1 Tax=Cirrhinus molitorella TaxID=172907 RepID=A0ABR3LRP6_9TELE
MNMQQETYASEFNNIQKQTNVPKQSSISKLRPVIDREGLLRVGGTNFTGASKELNLELDADIQRYLQEQQCTWIFNPPHASHMGGAWERLIGVARRILDSMLLQQRFVSLTHNQPKASSACFN